MILRPTSPAHGGASVARDEEGRVWLVNYALPGEVVEAEPRGKQGGVAVARAVQVIEASPNRIEPKCPHFGECGGCQWQHAAYEHQLELKRQVVEEAWSRAGTRLHWLPVAGTAKCAQARLGELDGVLVTRLHGLLDQVLLVHLRHIGRRLGW